MQCPTCGKDIECEEWLPMRRVVIRFGHSRSYYRRLIRDGEIRARKPARTWLIHVPSLLSYRRRSQHVIPRRPV